MRDMVSAVKELAPHVLVWNEAPSLLGGDYYVRVRASEDSPWTRSFIAKYSEEYLKEITPSSLCQYAGPIAAPLE